MVDGEDAVGEASFSDSNRPHLERSRCQRFTRTAPLLLPNALLLFVLKLPKCPGQARFAYAGRKDDFPGPLRVNGPPLSRPCSPTQAKCAWPGHLGDLRGERDSVLGRRSGTALVNCWHLPD